MSVVDATINPNKQKEEQIMETLDIPVPVMYTEEQMNELRQNREYWIKESNRVQGQLIDLINEYYEQDTDATSIIQAICEIIDYSPKKEIEFTATIRFTGRMEVDAWEYSNNFNISDVLSDAYVDINNGDVVIDNYDLEDAEEC